MAPQGIKITDLRPEIQTLVNSDPTKYNPNRNSTIDDGDELSLLLSEYQCTKEDLTKKGGTTMLTNGEKEAVEKYVDKNSTQCAKWLTYAFGGCATLGAAAGTAESIDKSLQKGFFENKKYTKNIDVETLVKDGSYTKGARPAYDVGKFMRQYISEDAFNEITYKFNNGESLAEFTSGTNDRCGRGATRDINGKPFVLREWKPGDPQYVKTGTRAVEVMKKKLSLNGKYAILGTLGTLALGTLTYCLGKGFEHRAADEKITSIKAEQTKVGQQIMEKRRQEEAEKAEREAALKQEELEYRERMNAATAGVEQNVSSADKKAKSINRELNSISKKVKENTQKPDSVKAEV